MSSQQRQADSSKKKRAKKIEKKPSNQAEGLKQVSRGYGERKILQELPKVDSLTFGEVLGYGHFSHVYAGTFKNKPAAIKIIERGSRRLVEKEIILLQKLRNLPYIIQLYEVIDLEETTLLIFERANSISPEDFYETISLSKLRHVLRCILTGLRNAHEHGIVHRDVKLGNIMISPDFDTVKLIDWGCGSSIKGKLSSKAGSRTCRSIEMLLGFDGYATQGDMWAVGTFIYSILCGGKLPWRSPNSWQTVVTLASFFGRRNILELASRLNCDLPTDVVDAIKATKPTRLNSKFDESMSDMLDPDLIDLMNHLLDINYQTRYNAAEALEHPFFAKEDNDEYSYEYSYDTD